MWLRGCALPAKLKRSPSRFKQAMKSPSLISQYWNAMATREQAI